MRALLVAAALVAALPAVAQQRLDPRTNPDTRYVWYGAPHTTDAGDARIRIVFDGREGAAVLTPNQYWHYAEAYKRALARLTLRGARSAEGQARHLAFGEVVARYPNLRVEGVDLAGSYGEAVVQPNF